MTVAVPTAMSVTYRRSPTATPRPRRCPIVNASMPSCAPTTAAVLVDDRCPTARGMRAPRNASRPPRVMKHTSMLSRLSAVRRPSARRVLAHLGLGQLADREQRARELVGAEHVEHVRLVLGGVGGTRERGPVVGRHDAGVVTGRDEVVVELARPLEHAPELHRAVALDARVRRLAAPRTRRRTASTTSASNSSEKLKT